MDVNVGDTIEVRSNKLDVPPRRGQVTGVVDHAPLELQVRWEDGHESVFFPHAGQAQVVERSGE